MPGNKRTHSTKLKKNTKVLRVRIEVMREEEEEEERWVLSKQNKKNFRVPYLDPTIISWLSVVV